MGGLPSVWEVLMKGLANGKYVDGQEERLRAHGQGSLQQAKESGQH